MAKRPSYINHQSTTGNGGGAGTARIMQRGQNLIHLGETSSPIKVASSNQQFSEIKSIYMRKRNQAQLLTSRAQAITEVLNQSADGHRAPNWSQVNKSFDAKKLVAAVHQGYQS